MNKNKFEIRFKNKKIFIRKDGNELIHPTINKNYITKLKLKTCHFKLKSEIVLKKELFKLNFKENLLKFKLSILKRKIKAIIPDKK